MPRFDETEDPRRRVLIQALAAGLFSATWHDPADAISIFGRPPKKLPPTQSIYRIGGTVHVSDVRADIDTRINANDTVKTGDKSEVVFVVGENAYILRSNSELVLEAPEKESRVVTAMRFVRGALLAVSPSRRRPTRVQTRLTTIGIRGTGYYIESDPEKDYFCTCYGTTEVSANDDPESKQTVVSEYHDKPLYIVGGQQAGRAIQPGPFINHTDQELMLIETLVGREPPYVFPEDEYSAPRRDY